MAHMQARMHRRVPGWVGWVWIADLLAMVSSFSHALSERLERGHRRQQSLIDQALAPVSRLPRLHRAWPSTALDERARVSTTASGTEVVKTMPVRRRGTLR